MPLVSLVLLTTIAMALALAIGFLIAHRHPQTSRPRHGSCGEYTKDPTTLAAYASDASWFRIMPKEVFYPHNTAEIQSIVRAMRTRKKNGEQVALTVRAGGTCMSGGSLTEGTVIDMTRHMTRVTIDRQSMTATVLGGAYFRDIEDAAAKHGLMFAAYPSSHRVCGIGGMIGNNASGEKSLRGGATGDNIKELEVVLADGSVRRVSEKSLTAPLEPEEQAIKALYTKYGKRLGKAIGEVTKAASGYRLDRVVHDKIFNTVPLFAGSQGTLGIVTKAVLQLVPIPKHTALVVVSAKDLPELPKVLDIAFEHNPESLETFDNNTFAKAREHLAMHAERMEPYIDAEAKLFVLIQVSEATQEETDRVAESLLASLVKKKYHVARVTDPIDADSVWQVRRNSFLLMRDHNPEGFRAVPCIEDIIVPRSAIGELIEGLLPILRKHTEQYGFHGHIGDGSLRIIPIFDFRRKDALDSVFVLMRAVFPLVKRLKGNMSADHSDGIIRTPFLREFYGDELYTVFEEIKKIYDPENIFNPGKKTGGTIESIRTYLQ